MTFYAHTLEGHPPNDWERMNEHEERVAHLCSEFLTRIHPKLKPWDDLLGRWHDLGKYSDKFQNYLHAANSSDPRSETNAELLVPRLPPENALSSRLSLCVDHSTAGSQCAKNSYCKRITNLHNYVIAMYQFALLDIFSKNIRVRNERFEPDKRQRNSK